MSLDTLPTIVTPYPSIEPTYDISQYLVNGCEAFSQGSVMATVEGNHVFWDCRIRTSGAGGNPSRRFLQGLPPELTTPIGVTRAAMQGADHTVIGWHPNGWVYLTDANAVLSAGVISFEARTIRRSS